MVAALVSCDWNVINRSCSSGGNNSILVVCTQTFQRWRRRLKYNNGRTRSNRAGFEPMPFRFRKWEESFFSDRESEMALGFYFIFSFSFLFLFLQLVCIDRPELDTLSWSSWGDGKGGGCVNLGRTSARDLFRRLSAHFDFFVSKASSLPFWLGSHLFAMDTLQLTRPSSPKVMNETENITPFRSDENGVDYFS